MAAHAIGLQAASLAAAGLVSGALGSSPPVLSTLTLTGPTSGERVGAGLATIDVAGIPSMDHSGSPNNTVLFLWVGPFNYVNGIGWDVVLQTLVPASRRRDITMIVRDTNNGEFSGFFVQPGAVDPTPGGPTPYRSDGILKLANFGIQPVQALADGLIRLEFLDSPDNAPGAADGLWTSGTVSIQAAFAIPDPVAPGTVGLLGVAGIASVRRYRGLTRLR